MVKGAIGRVLFFGMVWLGCVAATQAQAPDCRDWNTRKFIKKATGEDAAACLKSGADPMGRTRGGNTPLHMTAAENENPAVVQMLPAAGADVNARDEDDTAGSGQAGTYIGAFAGLGAVNVRLTDTEGFSGSNGVPGQTFEYGDSGLAAGVVAGRYFHLGRVPLLFEADGAFGGLPAAARQMDPVGLDETAASELHWVGTARIGVRRSVGRAGVFVAGGLSVAGISNSFTDLDVGTDGRSQVDPDDSFNERSTRVGWVAGDGIETPVAGAWSLRFEGLYKDFGETVHQAENQHGVNAGVCGPGGLPSPCRYGFDQRFALLRLVLVRRLGR